MLCLSGLSSNYPSNKEIKFWSTKVRVCGKGPLCVKTLVKEKVEYEVCKLLSKLPQKIVFFGHSKVS